MSLPSHKRNRNQAITKMPYFGPAVKRDPSKADPLAWLIQGKLGNYQRVKPFILEHSARLLGVRPARSQTHPDTQPHNNERREYHSHRYQTFMKPKNGKHSRWSSGKCHEKSIKLENLTDKHLPNDVVSTNSSTSQSTSTLLPVDYSMPSGIRAQSSILSRTTRDEANVQPFTTAPHPYNKQVYENRTEIKENHNLYQHMDVTEAKQKKYLSGEYGAISGENTIPKKRISKHRCQGIFPFNSPTTFTASSLPSLISSDSSSVTATDHNVTP